MFISILLLLVLLILNGFFASSEMALVSVNRTKIKAMADEGDKKARSVYSLITQPNRFLSTIQIGITLANLLAGGVAASQFARPLTDTAIKMGFTLLSSGTLLTVITFVLTLILALITIIFGELVPKRIALKNPEKRAKFSAGIINKMAKLTYPMVWFLTKSTNAVVKLFGVVESDNGNQITEEELRLMISASEENGGIEEHEKEMINNVFEFNDTPVDDLMTHRSKVAAIADDISFEELIDIVSEENYSRYPVYHNTLDDIIGVVHIKDLLTLFKHADKDIKKVMRKPYFVPEGKLADELLGEMKSSKNHLAVVVDEYGLTAGVITMEDLIEEIVGRIYDEHDTVDFMMHQTEENTYLVNGMLHIDDLNKMLDLKLPTDEYDTFAGFIIGLLGYIPQDGEKPSVVYENLSIFVEQVKKKTITLVKVVIAHPEGETSSGTEQ